eukprot:GHVH01006118.1.p1 GENE.GHVH01006118.1~~GHVH01006118.1.p1  ORF type:complete len:156 (-),score=19.69 GHVH01006118.1:173-607(-)
MYHHYVPGQYSGATNARVAKKQVTPNCQRCHQKGHWTYKCSVKEVEPVENRPRKKVNVVYDDVPDVPRITDGDWTRDPVLRAERELERNNQVELRRKADNDRRVENDKLVLLARIEKERLASELKKTQRGSSESSDHVIAVESH